MRSLLSLADLAVRKWGAQQKPGELAEFASILREQDCLTVLDVGTHKGGSAWFFDAAGFVVTSIDLDCELLTYPQPGVAYFVGDSHLIEGHWDAVFVDGDHTLAGVRRDWERFRGTPILGFHDIVEHPNCWVSPLWREIQSTNKTLELIAMDGESWGGVGVVFA